jgi:hypothetical protein
MLFGSECWVVDRKIEQSFVEMKMFMMLIMRCLLMDE